MKHFFGKPIAYLINFFSEKFPSNYYGYRYSYYKYKNEHYLAHHILKEPKDFKNILELKEASFTNDFKSDTKIQPLNLDFSFSEEAVIQQKGKPRLIVTEKFSAFFQKTFFFKTKIDAFSFMTQFHFINGRLWVIKQDVSYINSQTDNFDQITNLLFKKYSIDLVKNGARFEQARITDNYNNCIFIKTGVKTEIIYYYHEPTIISILKDWIKETINFKARESKLIEKRLLKNL